MLTPLSVELLNQHLAELGSLLPHPTVLRLHSQAEDRTTYLQRPDLGRALHENARQILRDFMAESYQTTQSRYDLAIVVVDGLSSLAVQQNAVLYPP